MPEDPLGCAMGRGFENEAAHASGKAFHLLLYDGVCGLCNQLNQFVLAHDHHDKFRFASLQGDLARKILEQSGRRANDLDTFYIVPHYAERAGAPISKAQAALFVLQELGRPWSWTRVFGLLPARLLDAGYDVLAKNRYRWFGRYDSCVVPSRENRWKFLDHASPSDSATELRATARRARTPSPSPRAKE